MIKTRIRFLIFLVICAFLANAFQYQLGIAKIPKLFLSSSTTVSNQSSDSEVPLKAPFFEVVEEFELNEESDSHSTPRDSFFQLVETDLASTNYREKLKQTECACSKEALYIRYCTLKIPFSFG